MEKECQEINISTLNINKLSCSVFRVLAYFDVFDYPLSAEEIYEFHDLNVKDIKALKIELQKLVSEKYIKKLGHFYFLGDETCVSRRKLANGYSEILMKESQKYSRLISWFPFVRGVCISGSLAKKNAHTNADVDYFIITEKNRLWICRTLLVLYKKIFLLNSSKYFCINYFVDTRHLEIMERNIYTATETAFLIPVYNQGIFLNFVRSNVWFRKYYPGKKLSPPGKTINLPNPYIKKLFEFLLDNGLGNAIDNFCLNLTLAYRKIKFRDMNEKEFENNLKAKKGISKHHPHSFQDKVLQKYKERLSRLELQYGINLS